MASLLIATIPMTWSKFQGHSHIICLFKYFFCVHTAFDKISTDTAHHAVPL